MTNSEKLQLAEELKVFNQKIYENYKHKIPEFEELSLKFNLNEAIESQRNKGNKEFTISMPSSEDMISYDRYVKWLNEHSINYSIDFVLSKNEDFFICQWFNKKTITEKEMSAYMKACGFHYITEIAGWKSCEIKIKL